MRRALYAVGQSLHTECGGCATRLDNLHQTLAFLGSMPNERNAELMRLAGTLRGTHFTLDFGVTGYWRHNRIVWAAPHETPPPLYALVDALRDALRAAGLRVEDRPYASHITLMRDARPPTKLPRLAFTWKIDGFTLVASVTGERGSEYRVLARWPLQPAAAG